VPNLIGAKRLNILASFFCLELVDIEYQHKLSPRNPQQPMVAPDNTCAIVRQKCVAPISALLGR
jgi:hypothetical protein